MRLFLAVILPALMLGLVECGLRQGPSYVSPDFFVPDDSGEVAFVRDNPRFSWQFFPRQVARAAPALRFAVPKTPGKIRIFILGASAAQGDPAPSYGFGRVLEVMLERRYPAQDFEVINTAITATNSHVVLPIAREVAQYEPDLAIIYLGNNEVVGPYGGGSVFGGKAGGIAAIRAQIALRRTGLGQAVTRAAEPASGAAEWRGMEMFLDQQVAADSPGLAQIHANYRRNLQDIVAALRGGGAGVVLSTVAVNLYDCGPFAALGRTGLTAAQSATRDSLLAAAAIRLKSGDSSGALVLLEQAAEQDSLQANLHFLWGRTLAAAEGRAAARSRLEQALESDGLRFRADRGINAAIIATAADVADPQVVLADVATAVGAAAAGGVSGHEHFVDHVHFNFAGQVVAAQTLLTAVEDLLSPRLAAPVAGSGAASMAAVCASDLAYTAFDEARIVTEMLRRLERAPFTNQVDHAEQVNRLRERQNQLRAAATPSGRAAMLATYEMALAARPHDRLLQRNRSRLRADAGDWAGAAADLAVYTAAYPQDAPARSEEADLLVQAGDFSGAARIGEQLVAGWPDFVAPRYTLAYAQSRLGRTDESLALYADLLARDPGKAADIHNAVGRLEMARGAAAAAAVAFAAGIEACGREEDVAAADLVYNLSQALVRSGDRPAAARERDRAADMYAAAADAGQPGARLMQARVELERGRPAAAEEAFLAALEADACAGDGARGLVQALMAQGRTADARAAASHWSGRLTECGEGRAAAELTRFLDSIAE